MCSETEVAVEGEGMDRERWTDLVAKPRVCSAQPTPAKGDYPSTP